MGNGNDNERYEYIDGNGDNIDDCGKENYQKPDIYHEVRVNIYHLQAYLSELSENVMIVPACLPEWRFHQLGQMRTCSLGVTIMFMMT